MQNFHLSEGCETRKNEKCIFPFNYNGSPRNHCIREGYEKFWCATATDENGDMVKWGVCGISCDVSEGGCVTLAPRHSPTSGKKCVFPFNYNGSPRNHCINEGPNGGWDGKRYWCATATDENDNYIEDQWGQCDRSCDTGECHAYKDFFAKNYTWNILQGIVKQYLGLRWERSVSSRSDLTQMGTIQRGAF